MSSSNMPSHEEPAVSPGKLVFWVDVFLLGILGLLTLACLPRAMAHRFSTRGSWTRGHYLQYSPKNAVRFDSSSSSRRTLSKPKPKPSRFGHLSIFSTSRLTSSDLIHNVRYFLRAPIIPGYSLGRVVLVAGYLGVLLFAALFRDSVFTNPVRAAYVAISQLPFVYALATKNSVFSLLLGVGYEKLNYLHRYAGCLVVLAANVHALGFIYKWTLQGVWTERLQEAEFRWGLVALVSFDILFFFSLSVFRQLSYNLFFFTHLVALIVVLVAVSLHQPASRPYTITTAGIYVLDRIIRILKSRIRTAHIECIPQLGTTLVRVKLNSGWRAGQHVRIRIFSTQMGVLGWTEMHPYTIANAVVSQPTEVLEASSQHVVTEGKEGELTLLVKKTGDWSRALYAIAESKECDSWPDGGTDVRVHIDGPYGGPGNTVLSSFSGALFLVGGSGISFALAAVREIIQEAAERAARSLDGNSGMDTIEIVWTVQHARAITPLLPLFTSLLQPSGSRAAADDLMAHRPSSCSVTSASQQRPALKISVYYTRANTYLDTEVLQNSSGDSRHSSSRTSHTEDHLAQRYERRQSPPAETSDFPPGLTVHASRPWIPCILNDFLDRTIATLPYETRGDSEKSVAEIGKGIVVGVCGPTSLAGGARRAIGGMDGEKRKAVGGVEVLEEAFHW